MILYPENCSQIYIVYPLLKHGFHMLHIIKDTLDPLIDLIKDDPVRPEIDRQFRVSDHRFIAVLQSPETRAAQAVCCVSVQDSVPTTVAQLADSTQSQSVAVFYTIWSYQRGAARELLFELVDYIRSQHPTVARFVTLSPKTQMAHDFHTRNGAGVLQENPETVNYEYRVL